MISRDLRPISRDLPRSPRDLGVGGAVEQGPTCFGGCSELCFESSFPVSLMNPDQMGTKLKTGDLAEIKKVADADAKPVDCITSDWSIWSKCSKTCGGGSQKRTRVGLYQVDGVTTRAKNGGKCGALVETQNCNECECLFKRCRPKVGDTVKLVKTKTPYFKKYIGTTGKVEKDDRSNKPFFVRGGYGGQWWYPDDIVVV